MEYKAFKCPSCEGDLVVSPDGNWGNCEYCGTKIRIKKDKAYGNSIDEKMQAAITYLTKLDNPDEAQRIFSEITRVAPGDYRCWLGLAICNCVFYKKMAAKRGSDGFRLATLAEYNEIAKRNFENALRVAPDDKKDRLTSVYEEYCTKALSSVEEEKVLLDDMRQISDNIENISTDMSRYEKQATAGYALNKVSLGFWLVDAAAVILAIAFIANEIGSAVLVPIGVFVIVSAIIAAKISITIFRARNNYASSKAIVEIRMTQLEDLNERVCCLYDQWTNNEVIDKTVALVSLMQE